MAGAAFLAGAAAPFFAEDALAVDLAAEPVVLAAVFAPAPADLPAVVLLAVALPEPDLAAVDLVDAAVDFFAAAVPEVLPAEAFEADAEAFAGVDFAVDLAAGFAAALPEVAFAAVFAAPLAELDLALDFVPEVLPEEAAFVGAAFFPAVGTDLVIGAFLLAAGAAFAGAAFLFVVVDFVELFAGFLVAIFFSLRF